MVGNTDVQSLIFQSITVETVVEMNPTNHNCNGHPPNNVGDEEDDDEDDVNEMNANMKIIEAKEKEVGNCEMDV